MLKRDKRDRVFSNLIRERVGWICERCGKYYPEGHRRGLDCSHFFGRRHRATRWHPDNAFAHCRGCHQYLSENPDLFVRFVKDTIGETRYEALRQKHNQVKKYTRQELEEIYLHLKECYNSMLEKRKDGDENFLDFPAYD